jgi:hypothetical protein
MVRKRIVLESPEGDVLFWGYSQLRRPEEDETAAANDDTPRTREQSHSGIYPKALAKTGT